MNENIFSILLGLVIAIPTGVFTGLIVKIYFPTHQEKIYNKNRNSHILILLDILYTINNYKNSIFSILEKNPQFSVRRRGGLPFSDYDYKTILRYNKAIFRKTKDIPSFSNSSSFLSFEEYHTILQYIHSSIFLVETNISTILFYDEKIYEDHAQFAKNLLRLFDKELDNGFKEDWKQKLSELGMLQPGWKPRLVEPGDMYHSYYEFPSNLKLNE